MSLRAMLAVMGVWTTIVVVLIFSMTRLSDEDPRERWEDHPNVETALHLSAEILGRSYPHRERLLLRELQMRAPCRLVDLRPSPSYEDHPDLLWILVSCEPGNGILK